MPHTTAYQRRTRPRWRIPVLISLVLSIVLGSTGMIAYAQVQGGEREFTSAPATPATEPYVPAEAQGDWTVRASLSFSSLKDAVALAIPEEVARLEWVDELVPYWSLEKVEMNLSAVVHRQSEAQLTVFGQELEVIQPLRLEVKASTDDVSETETRDFIVAARFGVDLDEAWNWKLIELEPARILGFGAPRLFGSLSPDLSTIESQLNADLAPELLDNMMTELNRTSSLASEISLITRGINIPSGSVGTGAAYHLNVIQGNVNDVRLRAAEVEVQLVVTLAKATEGDAALPSLQSEPKDAESFRMPVAFSAGLEEVARNLAQNERLLSIEDGELLVNKIRVLRPFGDALLVKVDAEQIDPGGHRFKKRGTFHVLVKFGLHGPTQTIRVVDASMPDSDTQLSFALRDRDWLQSDSLALGLVSGLSGISRQAEVRAYLSDLEAIFDGLPQLQGQDLGDVRFSLGEAVYSDSLVTSYAYATVHPEIYLSQ